MLASFEPQLRWFYKWWVQLFAETEGKDGRGLFPVCGEYSEELHAVGQFVQDGTPLMFETFLDVLDPGASLVIEMTAYRMPLIIWMAWTLLRSTVPPLKRPYGRIRRSCHA